MALVVVITRIVCNFVVTELNAEVPLILLFTCIAACIIIAENEVEWPLCFSVIVSQGAHFVKQ